MLPIGAGWEGASITVQSFRVPKHVGRPLRVTDSVHDICGRTVYYSVFSDSCKILFYQLVISVLYIDRGDIRQTPFKTRRDKTLFRLGSLLNGVGGIYTKYLCKTRDKMVEKHINK